MKEGKNCAPSARTWCGNSVLRTFCSLLSAGILIFYTEPGSTADRIETAALSPGIPMVREAELPAILGPSDIARYRMIKVLQDEGRWSAADNEIASLQDPILVGHVLAQRYLHRTTKVGYEAL